MSRIIVPSRRVWKRQPQRPVSIDRSNPICRGLFAAKCGALSYGFSRFAAPTAVGVPGISITNPVATDLYSPLDVPVTSSEWTLFCLAITPNISSYNSAWGLYGGTSARIHQHFRVYAGATGADCRPYAPDSSSGWNFPINTVVPFATVISGSGNFIKHYANKVKNSSATLSSTSAITVNTAEFFAKSLTNTDQASINTKLFVCIAWSRALSDREIVAISENPWQIFRPRTRRTIIDLGVSGLSTVYADSALAYYIRSLLSSDSGIQYAIRNAIYKDDAVGYYLRSAIAQNSEVGYVLRSAIAKDDAEAYKIRGLVQASDAEAYSIRGLVQASDGEAYKIRSQVQADASTSYDIQSSTSVASSNAVNYSVRGAVAASVLVGYSVRGSAQRDATSAYSVRSAASRDVVASYSVSAAASSVYADSTASYSVDGVVPSGPSAESIAAAVDTVLAARFAAIPDSVWSKELP